jgi:hypothetical protein
MTASLVPGVIGERDAAKAAIDAPESVVVGRTRMAAHFPQFLPIIERL